MKYEYKEGSDARDTFEQAMKTLFKAPKTVKVGAKVKRPAKGASDRTDNVSGKS